MTTTYQELILAKIEGARNNAIGTNYDYYQSDEKLHAVEMPIYDALRVVVEMHTPLAFNDKWYCRECPFDGNNNMRWYPCPTIRAIGEKLGVEE